MDVRRVKCDEYDEVGALAVAAYRAIPLDVSGPLERYLRDVGQRNRESCVLVALDAASIVGTVTYVPGPDAASAEFTEPDACGMRALAVATDATGRGVGRALVEAVIGLGRRDGRSEVILHTTPAMVPARVLYARMGFARDTLIDWSPAEDVQLLGYRYKL